MSNKCASGEDIVHYFKDLERSRGAAENGWQHRTPLRHQVHRSK